MLKQKIRDMLAKFGHTQTDLAEALGITYQSVSIKLNGKSDFTRSEIYRIMKMYNLTSDQLYDIFFSDDSMFDQNKM